MTPRRLFRDDPALPKTLSLIRDSFAYMDGLIDPPSSIHSLTLTDLTKDTCELWVIGIRPIACVILTARPPALYIGKLAVAETHRGQGHARSLIDHAETRARASGLTRVELQIRVELTANQATFTAMGFVETARTAHHGYNRATSITYQRKVTP